MLYLMNNINTGTIPESICNYLRWPICTEKYSRKYMELSVMTNMYRVFQKVYVITRDNIANMYREVFQKVYGITWDNIANMYRVVFQKVYVITWDNIANMYREEFQKVYGNTWDNQYTNMYREVFQKVYGITWDNQYVQRSIPERVLS